MPEPRKTTAADLDAATAAASPATPPAKSATPAKVPLTPKKRATLGNVAAGLAPKNRKSGAGAKKVEDTFEYDTALRLGFLGAGQGGGRIASSFYNQGYRRVAVFNTTSMDFNDLPPEIPRLSLDVGGAAKDTAQAASALRGREEEVRDLLADAWGVDVDYGMIAVSLGGGTGGGTAASLVNIARSYLKDTCGHERVGVIVSLPSTAEGFQVARNAIQCFYELIQLDVSPLIVIDNAKIHELYSPSMSQLHATANDTVSQLLHLFNRLAASKSSMITFDQAELRQLFDSGLVVMGAADVAASVDEIRSPSQISSTIRDELANNVLAEVSLGTGLKGVCLFVGEQEVLDTLSLDYFDAGFTQLDRILGSDKEQGGKQTVLHRGVYVGDSPGLQVYTMVGDLGLPHARLQQLAEKGGLNQDKTKSNVSDWLGLSD